MVLFKKQGSVSETIADSAAIDLEDGATKEKNIVNIFLFITGDEGIIFILNLSVFFKYLDPLLSDINSTS